MGGLRVAGVVVLSCLGVAACSGGGGTESASDGSLTDSSTLATLEVLASQVAVRSDPNAAFSPTQDKRDLTQGDEIQTDSTGFAQVDFFDGSWQRIDANTTLAITELVAIENGHVVRTGLDQGRAWNRVQTLTNDNDAYEVDTPVAVASVRGTEFSIDCAGDPVACSFAVVDGVVRVAVSSAPPVDVGAGQTLTVALDQPVGTPSDVGVDQLRQDPWIAENLARDQSSPPSIGGGPSGTSPPPATGDFASAANQICAAAGAQNAAVDLSAASDDVASRQADILDGALDQLQTLSAPAELADRYQAMIDDYRRRTTLVRQAVSAPQAERAPLVGQLLDATAAGAAVARDIGLDECVLRSS